jgi:hypothetical protein
MSSSTASKALSRSICKAIAPFSATSAEWPRLRTAKRIFIRLVELSSTFTARPLHGRAKSGKPHRAEVLRIGLQGVGRAAERLGVSRSSCSRHLCHEFGSAAEEVVDQFRQIGAVAADHLQKTPQRRHIN